MDQEQCLNKLQYVMEVLDKIHRGYDYITGDGKVNDFTDAEKDEMVKKATVALSEVAFYINGGCKVDRSDIRTVNLWHYPTLRKDNRHWPTFRENELPEPKYGMEVDCLVVRRSTNKSISTLHYVIDKFDCLGGYFERTPMEYVHSWCYLEQLSPLYPLFDSESTVIRVNKK